MTFALQASHPPGRPATSSLDTGNCLVSALSEDVAGKRRFQLTARQKQTAGLSTEAIERRRRVLEDPAQPLLVSGSAVTDGLFALALEETKQNAVSAISDAAFAHGEPYPLEAFVTGEEWNYVWTRDLAYAVDLGLAGLDPSRCLAALMFKTSDLKPGARGPAGMQVLQDTGSGGSYPVSTDRVVWALGASRLLRHLPQDQVPAFVATVAPILANTAEQDRRVAWDPADGLYRGEQSFLDWREQTYPAWTKHDVLPIARSKCLSTNLLHLHLLRTACDFARRLGRLDEAGLHEAARYEAWAEQLQRDIRAAFVDGQRQLLPTYLLAQGRHVLPAPRHDLLSHALAIQLNVVTPAEARRLVSLYPFGPHGPAVTWPQDAEVPIYHNHAMWPFVTAYWALAAARVGHAAAFDAALDSIISGAGENLSNMENLDFATGRPYAQVNGLAGPTINSRRQLWSVAAFIGVVQQAWFGIDIGQDGIDVRPFVTRAAWRHHLGGSGEIWLRGVRHGTKRIDVCLVLPGRQSPDDVAYVAASARLNGRQLAGCFVGHEALEGHNTIVVMLRAADEIDDVDTGDVRVTSEPAAYFAPRVPTWRAAGLEVHEGRVHLYFDRPDDGGVVNIYRDGKLLAAGIHGSTFEDPEPVRDDACIREYVLETFDRATGHRSHPSELRTWCPATARVTLDLPPKVDATDMSLDVPFEVTLGGRYSLRLEYSHPAGVATGICCVVARGQVVEAGSDELLAETCMIMPQTHENLARTHGSPVEADLVAGRRYVFRLRQDASCVNMSHFAHFDRYTGGPGGGHEPHNHCRLLGLEVCRVAAPKDQAAWTGP